MKERSESREEPFLKKGFFSRTLISEKFYHAAVARTPCVLATAAE
jgi:hypothetical protein